MRIALSPSATSLIPSACRSSRRSAPMVSTSKCRRLSLYLANPCARTYLRASASAFAFAFAFANGPVGSVWVSLRIDDPRSNPSIHRRRDLANDLASSSMARENILSRVPPSRRVVSRVPSRVARRRARFHRHRHPPRASTNRLARVASRRLASTRLARTRESFFLHRFRASVFARGARARRRARRCRGGSMSIARRNGR